jgi:hypothetical protein
VAVPARRSTLFLLQLPFHAAIVALTWRLPEEPEGRELIVPALMIWLIFVVESLALAVAARRIDAARRGEEPRYGRAWIDTVMLAPRLVATHLMASVLVVVGLVLLVVPGVMVATRLAFVPLAVALDGLGGRAALGASRARNPRARELLLLNLPVLVPIAIVQNLPPAWVVLAFAAVAGAAVATWTHPWAVRRYQP